MFNLSPQDIIGIQEAYQSVYCQEDVEQLDELIGAAIGSGFGYLAGKAGQGFMQGLRGGGDKPTAKPSPTQSKFAGARDQAFAKARQIQGSPVVGSRPSPAARAARPAATSTSARPSGGSAAPSARPASVPAKPAPTAAAKTAPAAPVSRPAAQPKIKQDVADIKSMQAASQARQAAPTPKVAPKPTNVATGSKKPGSIVSGFDIFDVVKGYLLDEGFAETEDAAIAIMANMSEEWRSEILDEAEKWIQKAIKKPGALHKQLGVPEGEKIPAGKLSAAAEKGGKLGKRARLAQTLKGLNK